MENVNEKLCEYVHLHALVLSPAWLREIEEGFPLAWFSIEGHQLTPVPFSEASEAVFFFYHQPSPPSSCAGTATERAVGSRNVWRKLILEQMCVSEKPPNLVTLVLDPCCGLFADAYPFSGKGTGWLLGFMFSSPPLLTLVSLHLHHPSPQLRCAHIEWFFPCS